LTIFSLGGDFTLVDPRTLAVVRRGSHALPISPLDAVVSADGSTMAGSVNAVDYPVWRGAAAYSPVAEANAVASTDVVSTQLALAGDGSRVAAAVEGTIEVAEVRAPNDAFTRPVRLEGAGAVNQDTLEFGGSRYLSHGTGERALVWDLEQQYRFGSQARTDVPQGCTACGLVGLHVSPDGTKVLMSARGSFDGPVVADVESGEAVQVDPGGELDLQVPTWLDDEHVIGYAGRREQLVRIGVDGTGATPLMDIALPPDTLGQIVTDGDPRGITSLLTRDGTVRTVDLGAEQVVRTADVLSDQVDPGGTFHLGLAPDQSSAFVQTVDPSTFEDRSFVVDILSNRVVHSGSAVSAAYDARSRSTSSTATCPRRVRRSRRSGAGSRGREPPGGDRPGRPAGRHRRPGEQPDADRPRAAGRTVRDLGGRAGEPRLPGLGVHRRRLSAGDCDPRDV
jgi:hypothetical protein